jgi:hypothetical protein
MRVGLVLAMLCMALPAAAQQTPDDYGPTPDDYGPSPSGQRQAQSQPTSDRADATPPVTEKLERQAPILQLAWRRFAVGRAGDAMPGTDSAMDGIMFEWYPVSSFVRFGLATEYARENSSRNTHDWYIAEHLSLGLQKPGPITPFIEGSVGAGYFKRFVVSQEQPTAIWEFGANVGALFHFNGPAFVSVSAGWVHPVWLLLSVDQMSLTQVYRDSFAIKLGLGF